MFTLESSGTLKAKRLFSDALTVIINKIDNFNKLLDEFDIKENKTNDFGELDVDITELQITKSNVKFDAFDYIFTKESHTLGNLLSRFLNDNKDAKYAGYDVPHPMHPKMIVRLSTKIKATDVQYNIVVMKSTLKELRKLIEDLKEEWNK